MHQNKSALDYTREVHPKLLTILNPLMNNSPVTGFVYMEMMGPEEFFFLSSDPRWGDEYLMRGSPGETWVEGLKFAATIEKPSYITWAFQESQDPIEQYCVDLGYRYGANIYKKQGDKIRLWAFNGQDPHSLLFFQTEKNLLEKFIFYFEENACNLFNEDCLHEYSAQWKKPLDLTVPCHLSNSPSIPDPRYVSLQVPRGIVKLTLRQWEILRIAAQGLSMKEIAHILKISPRTVEGTLLVIREKTGLLNRDKLVELVKKNSILG